MFEQSEDARDYYADGFRRTIGGVPCKVFSRRTADGRYIRPKASPFYDPEYDHPKTGRSRLTTGEHEAEAVEIAPDHGNEDLVRAFEAIVATAQHMVFNPERTPSAESNVVQLRPAMHHNQIATDIGPEAPCEPGQREDEPEATPQPEAPEIASSEPEIDDSEAMLRAGEIIGDELRALKERLAAVEAQLAARSVESAEPIESSPEMAENSQSLITGKSGNYAEMAENCHSSEIGRIRSNRSPARERLLRRYLAMRRQRDLDRRALLASAEHVRKIEHPNPPAPGLVAQIHDEREKAAEAGKRAAEAERQKAEAVRRSEALAQRLEELSGRAIRAEQALLVYRVKESVPVQFGGMSRARVSYEVGR